MIEHNQMWDEINEDEIELALAWARGQIALTQASQAWQKKTGKKHGMGVYVTIARALRKYIQTNNI